MQYILDPGKNNLLIIALVILIIILIIYLIYINKKINSFLVDKKAENIGDSIMTITKYIKDNDSFRKELENYLETVEKRVKKSTQAIYTVRFNPFKGTGSGGNQSFATAIISENGDGVIISTLYSREHVSMYAKPIKAHEPEFELTIEEKEALQKARGQLGA